jgi:putative transposase
MQYLNRFHAIKLRSTVRVLEKVLNNNNEVAQKRKEIIDFSKKHGVGATLDAYKISKSTLYNWKQKDSNHGLRGLVPESTAPIHKRGSKIQPLVKEYIKRYRNKHPCTGQRVIKPHLDKYCIEKGIKTISAGSIAIVIKQLKTGNELIEYQKVRYSGTTGRIHGVKPKKKRKKQRRKGYKPKEAGDLIQVDTITKFTDGIKHHIITAIDLKTRFAFALPYKNLNSINAKDFMMKFEKAAPFEIRRIQTDNGLEFEKHFRNYVSNRQLTHFHNYPRRPQSNGCVERFNRTIQEQFINWNLDLLNEPQKFADAMIEWLLWYNLERGHHSLNLKTPMETILEYKFGENYRNIKKSNMLLDYTSP